ncbi:hypothetical protein SynA1562_00857 [Synechococcus sp. A15-62]|nr:hypothetical protein SynA1562_00857 [Synechococcus sp. A15-62]
MLSHFLYSRWYKKFESRLLALAESAINAALNDGSLLV